MVTLWLKKAQKGAKSPIMVEAVDAREILANPDTLYTDVDPDKTPEQRKAEDDVNAMTVAQLTEELGKLEVDIPSGALKADLVALYTAAKKR